MVIDPAGVAGWYNKLVVAYLHVCYELADIRVCDDVDDIMRQDITPTHTIMRSIVSAAIQRHNDEIKVVYLS
jgi:hypothetical protein